MNWRTGFPTSYADIALADLGFSLSTGMMNQEPRGQPGPESRRAVGAAVPIIGSSFKHGTIEPEAGHDNQNSEA